MSDFNKIEKNNINVLSPFKLLVLQNFPFIEADFDAITNYQLMCKMAEYMNNLNTNVNTLNENENRVYKAFNEIVDYINNYFDNLDVQDEINQKLDNMATDGTLTQLIGNYVNPLIDNQNNIINNFTNQTNYELSILNSKVNSLTNVPPIAVSSINDMSDTSKIYVNTSDGKWYYYNGSGWVAGGIYQSTALELDDTLTNGEMAPNSEVVGENIQLIKNFNSTKITDYPFNYGVKNFFEFPQFTKYLDIVPGTGIEGNSNTTMATGFFNNITGSYRFLQKQASTNQIMIFHYNSEQTFIDNTSWASGSYLNYTFIEGDYYRIKIRRLGGGHINLNDIKNFKGYKTKPTIQEKFLYMSDYEIDGFNNINRVSYNMINFEKLSDYVLRIYIVGSLYLLDKKGSEIISLPNSEISEYYDINSNYKLVWDLYENTLKVIGANSNNSGNPYIVLLYQRYHIATQGYFREEFIYWMNKIYTDNKFDQVNLNVINLINESCKIIAHQGYRISGDSTIGNSRLSSFKGAYLNGFKYAECDIRWSSDEIPVCCHDASFTSNGETIVISEHTLAELKTYNYYGETIASFEEVIDACKKYGLTLELDQISSNWSNERFNKLYNIVNTYQMKDFVIWVGNQTVVTKVLQEFNNKAVCLINTITNYNSAVSAIASYSPLLNGNNKFIFAINHNNITVSELIELNKQLPGGIEVGVWTIDNLETFLQYYPYVTNITTNLITPSTVANYLKS